MGKWALWLHPRHVWLLSSSTGAGHSGHAGAAQLQATAAMPGQEGPLACRASCKACLHRQSHRLLHHAAPFLLYPPASSREKQAHTIVRSAGTAGAGAGSWLAKAPPSLDTAPLVFIHLSKGVPLHEHALKLIAQHVSLVPRALSSTVSDGSWGWAGNARLTGATVQPGPGAVGWVM